jgi:hypothetical protein
MATIPPEVPRTPQELRRDHHELGVFARIEGLLGEEEALLLIPAHQRKQHEHDRLRAVTEELDRIWERLRDRAARHATTAGA